MERPPARPEGPLIRLARQAAGLSIPDAVRLSGVSKARWSQVESGYETRAGVTRPVQAKADTLARMARAIGLTPERLESEGRRPDAAEILREILRSRPAAAPAAQERPRLSAVPERPSLPDDPTPQELHYFIAAQEPYELRKLLLDTLYFEAVKYPERIKGIRALTDPVDLGEEQAERRREPGA